MIANLLLYYAINKQKSRNYCVSPTLKQAKAIYNTIIEAIGNSPIVYKSNASDLEIKLINNSGIYFKSAEQGEALRGYTADFVAIDECAYISDDIFYTILPWVDAKRASMLLVSTPFVKEGFFWEYYNYGLEGINNTISINWSDEKYRESIEKILPPERLEEYRKILPKNQFKTEYLGEWLDDDGQVFTGFKECIKNKEIAYNDKLYVGLDWSSGVDGDDTVISIINQNAEQVFLAYWNDLNTTQTIDRIMGILNPIINQIVSIQPELNSIGKPYVDILTERLQPTHRSKIQGFTTTNQSKADLVSQLQVAFENGDINILDDEKQIRQLSIYAAEYNPKTKNVSYNAPRGLHDDIVIALMLSYDALKKRNASGFYCIGNTRMSKRNKPTNDDR